MKIQYENIIYIVLLVCVAGDDNHVEKTTTEIDCMQKII
jgi:hypothetical protein